MKTIKLTEEEINILLHAIHEWKSGNYDESSGFSKKQLKAMDSAERVLMGILNA
tara:strand:- start:32 stop:193 length:162 start_codon:yes stop_codon:yes gene_type:complete